MQEQEQFGKFKSSEIVNNEQAEKMSFNNQQSLHFVIDLQNK